MANGFVIKNDLLIPDGKIGIGITAPERELHIKDVSGIDNTIIQLENSEIYSTYIGKVGANNQILSGDIAGDLSIQNRESNIFLSTGTITTDGIAINSDGNVGIGNSSLEAWDSSFTALQIGGTASIINQTAGGTGKDLLILQNAYYDGSYKYQNTDQASFYIQQNGTHDFRVAVSGTEDTVITWTNVLFANNNGNIGIGNNSLESWSSDYTALQIGGNSAIMSQTVAGVSNNLYSMQNVYYDGSWRYIITDKATMYNQKEGEHKFHIASSGTADSVISFTTAMTIDNSGNVGIGNSSLEVWGDGWSALQIGGNGSLISNTSPGAGNNLSISHNAYHDGSWKYQNTDEASNISLNTGRINFNVAGVGTADTAITWNAAMRIDVNGNVGIGNSSLEPWVANFSALQIGGNASLSGHTTPAAGNVFYIMQNAYYDGALKYQDTDEASRYIQVHGTHSFQVAPSGTADTSISWTTALAINNTGLLTCSPTYSNDMNGDTVRSLYINSDGELGYDSNATIGYDDGDTIKAAYGTVSAPGLTFNGDTDTGFYRITANVLGAAINGTLAGSFHDYSGVSFRYQNGSVTRPSLCNYTDYRTGFYRYAAEEIGVTTAGSVAAVFADECIRVANGSQTAPSISFINDTNTGFYSNADQIGITCGGTARGSFQTTQLVPNGQDNYAVGTSSYYWSNVSSKVFEDVADYYYMDDRDDMSLLHQIKGSGVIEKSTGFELIDDNTLPNELISVHEFDHKDEFGTYKKGDKKFTPDGRPFIRTKSFFSLLMGACRQLDSKITKLEEMPSFVDGVSMKNLDKNLQYEISSEFKEYDGNLSNAIDKVNMLQPKFFKFKKDSSFDSSKRNLGLYANEVNKIIPEATMMITKDDEEIWEIYDRALISLLIRSSQELSLKIENQKEEINNLKTQLQTFMDSGNRGVK